MCSSKETLPWILSGTSCLTSISEALQVFFTTKGVHSFLVARNSLMHLKLAWNMLRMASNFLSSCLYLQNAESQVWVVIFSLCSVGKPSHTNSFLKVVIFLVTFTVVLADMWSFLLGSVTGAVMWLTGKSTCRQI